jgi:hypothetical protein
MLPEERMDVVTPPIREVLSSPVALLGINDVDQITFCFKCREQTWFARIEGKHIMASYSKQTTIKEENSILVATVAFKITPNDPLLIELLHAAIGTHDEQKVADCLQMLVNTGWQEEVPMAASQYKWDTHMRDAGSLANVEMVTPWIKQEEK